jgi:Transposase
VKELCQTHGFSDASFYKWRGRFGGMETSDARRLKGTRAREQQAENATRGGDAGAPRGSRGDSGEDRDLRAQGL